MSGSTSLQQAIKQLLQDQVQAVLATHDGNQRGPMMHLMAYAFCPDLKHIYLASRRDTSKVHNILQCGYVSMLWDDRTGTIDDHNDGCMLLARGEVELLDAMDEQPLRKALLLRNPTLNGLLAMQECCIMRLQVAYYQYTLGYQKTRIWDPNSSDEAHTNG